MSRPNISLRRALIDYMEAVLSNGYPDAIAIRKNTYHDYDYLTLVIKKYNTRGALSKFLHESNLAHEYFIEGPLVS